MRMRNTVGALLALTTFVVSARAQQDQHLHEGHVKSPGSDTKSSATASESRAVDPAVGPHGGTLKQLKTLQVETVVKPSGLRLFVYDSQKKPLDLRNARGLVMLQIVGETKRYRYDLFPEIAKDKSASSLAVAVDLSRISGQAVDLTYQLVGLPGAGRRPERFAVSVQVSMTKAQQVAAAIKAQKICPVSGQPLGGMGKPIAVTVDDQTVYVCCAGCIKAVKANPEKYFAKN